MEKQEENLISIYQQKKSVNVTPVDYSQKRFLKRESGLELLRILATFLIVMHCVHNSGYVIFKNPKLSMILGFGGKLGDDIFVLISAYFMVNKNFKLTRVLNLIFRATFYSVMFYFIALSFGKINFEVVDFVKAIFPVYFCRWWFITSFVLLMLLSPAINIILHSVPKKTLGRCILIMVSCTVLLPYVSKVLTNEFFEVPYINELFIFIELYCVGGYIKLYGVNLKKHLIVLIFCLTMIYGLIITYIGKFSSWYDFGGHWREFGWQISSFSNVVCSVCLLLIFKDFKFYSRVINIMASTTFGMYLIFENYYMRGWEFEFCRETLYASVSSPVLTFLLMAVTIFIGAMIIDLICLNTVHRIGNKFLQFIDKKITEKKAKDTENTQNSVN